MGVSFEDKIILLSSLGSLNESYIALILNYKKRKFKESQEHFHISSQTETALFELIREKKFV